MTELKRNMHSLQTERATIIRQMNETEIHFKGEQKKHRDYIRDLELQYKAELDRQKGDVKQLFEEEFTRHKDTLLRLRLQHKTESERQRIDGETRFRNMQQRYENTIKEMKVALPDVTELKKDIEKKRLQSQVELNSLKAQLGGNHERDIWHLRPAAEGKKKEPTGKHMKELKDHNIGGRFRVIVNEIDQFSRIEWDMSKETRWPCFERNMRQLHPQNTRKLKQYMIQSSLWTFIHERVFRSPFCVFGTAGDDMDRDWEDVYASCELSDQLSKAPANVLQATSPLTYPEVPLDVESKRCANARRCLALIDPAMEASADDTKLKNAYEMVVAVAIETFARLIENISSCGEQERTTLNNLMRLCTKVWLECCCQQYRLMVRLAVSDGNVLALGSKVTPSFRLIRSPELRKFGRLNGMTLCSEEPVSGWKGDIDTYPSY
jgi:hypothetical protein